MWITSLSCPVFYNSDLASLEVSELLLSSDKKAFYHVMLSVLEELWPGHRKYQGLYLV